MSEREGVIDGGGRPEKARILFVDDEPHILNSMRWLFKRDYDVTIAPGGQEAIDLLGQERFHVVVSDQRMPGISGIEVLREAKNQAPETMRILLTGYADLKAIVGSVNESEVFRFVTKPWVNQELKAVVKLAVDTAFKTAESAGREDQTPAGMDDDILVIDADPEIAEMVGNSLEGRFTVHHVTEVDAALALLAEHKVGVVVSETRVGNADITTLIKLLKQHQPEIVSVVVTEHGDTETIIELINQGQVYRFLQKPVKTGLCRLSVQSAMVKHSQMISDPSLVARHQVDKIDEAMIAEKAQKKPDSVPSTGVFKRLLSQVTRLPRWMRAT